VTGFDSDSRSEQRRKSVENHGAEWTSDANEQDYEEEQEDEQKVFQELIKRKKTTKRLQLLYLC